MKKVKRPPGSPALLITAAAQAAGQGLIRSALLTKLLPFAAAAGFVLRLFRRQSIGAGFPRPRPTGQEPPSKGKAGGPGLQADYKATTSRLQPDYKPTTSRRSRRVGVTASTATSTGDTSHGLDPR